MAKVRNRPSPVGIETGSHLARFTDKAEQDWHEAGMNFIPQRCASCAFRSGTVPNGCVTTVADAMKCTMERKPFHCHHGMKGHGPESVCAGWILLNSAQPPVQAPWKYSDEYE